MIKKNYPKLYSRATTGAIQVWWVEQDGDKYRSHSGQVDGKVTTSKWTVCVGKNAGKSNETTGDIQAQRDILSKYKKAKKQGCFEDIKCVDQDKGYISCTLAKKFKDRVDKIKYPVTVQRKYNGGRCITTKDLKMKSREGEQWLTCPHIYHALCESGFFKKFPDAVVDGELYNHDYRYNLNDLMSIVRRTANITSFDLIKAKDVVKYYVYDGYNIGGTTDQSEYLVRQAAIKEHLKGIPFIEIVPSYIAKSEDEVWALYDAFVEDGYEGAMVRINNSVYDHKRSSNLLKMKPEDDDEFLILDVIEGKGDRSGMAGKISLQMKDGREFKASMKGKVEQFTEVLNNKQKYIGKTVTIFYNGFTGLGIPNYARFDCNNWNKGDR